MTHTLHPLLTWLTPDHRSEAALSVQRPHTTLAHLASRRREFHPAHQPGLIATPRTSVDENTPNHV